MAQLVILAAVIGFLIGLCAMALYASKTVSIARQLAADAEATVIRDRAHAYNVIENLKAEKDEATASLADAMRRVNKMTDQIRQLKKR